MKFRLCIEIEYTGEATAENKKAITQTLRYAVDHLVGNGLLSEGTGLEVESWETAVKEVER